MQLEPTAEMRVARTTHSKKDGTGAKRRRTTFIYYDEEHEIGPKCGKAHRLLLKKAKKVTGWCNQKRKLMAQRRVETE